MPTLASISPTSANAGSPNFTLTVSGTNFISASVVRWNGISQVTTFKSATQLTAAITAADIFAQGSAQVTVFNPAPGGGASNALTFTINAPAPLLTSLSPSSAVATGPQFTLTANGANYVNGATINWNASAVTTSFGSSNQLTAVIPSTDIASAGSVPVTVTNPPPGGGTSAPATFTVTPLTPVKIATTRLPSTAGGKDYNYVLAANGGAPPFMMWVVTSGGLPSGLSLDSASGRITGTVDPAAAGTTANFTVQVTDSAASPQTTTQALSLQVVAGALGRNDTCPGGGSTAGSTFISNGTIRATISPYGDIDVYAFHATAGAQVTIETFAQQLDIGTNLTTRTDFLDTVLELLDQNCNVIALNDDLSASPHIQDSLIRVSTTNAFPTNPPDNPNDKPAPTSLTQTGIYYIRVRDFRGDGRPDLIYDLTLSGAD